MINQTALQQKLTAIAAFSESDMRELQKLGRVLMDLDDWALFRINPLRFADEYGFDPAAVVDLFIRGAKVGLFDFEWNMICPYCGGVENSHAAINEIEADHFHCTFCNVDTSSELDNQVEVAFSINPGIAKPDIAPFTSFEDYWHYYFSRNFSWPAAMEQYIHAEALREFTVLESDDETRLSFTAQPQQLFRLISIDKHAGLELHFSDARSEIPQIVDVDLLPSGFVPTEVTLPAGAVTLHVHNRLPAAAGLSLMCIDKPRIGGILSQHHPTLIPFFTGKMLINNQTFRDLFRVQNLPYDLRLKVSNITLLFTDLKGSTELYDATGDMVAYNLVQDHFNLLKAAAHDHAGAVIKTMGDAIMASFSNPFDGVMAAMDMRDKIATMNRRLEIAGHEIGLKVGLHAGSALAVNANETLDYFGQTVNIAARVQGLAQAGEIWLTAPVYETEKVQDMLRSKGYRAEKQTAILKGVREHTTVYKCV